MFKLKIDSSETPSKLILEESYVSETISTTVRASYSSPSSSYNLGIANYIKNSGYTQINPLEEKYTYTSSMSYDTNGSTTTFTTLFSNKDTFNVKFDLTLTSSTDTTEDLSITNILINNSNMKINNESVKKCKVVVNSNKYEFTYITDNNNEIINNVIYDLSTNSFDFTLPDISMLSVIYFETLFLGINAIYDCILENPPKNVYPEYSGMIDLSMTGLWYNNSN